MKSSIAKNRCRLIVFIIMLVTMFSLPNYGLSQSSTPIVSQYDPPHLKLFGKDDFRVTGISYDFSIAANSAKKAIAAVLNGDGHIHLRAYDVSNSGSLEHIASSAQEPILGKNNGTRSLSVAFGNDPSLAVLAFVGFPSGHSPCTVLVTYRISPDGRTITRLHDCGRITGQSDTVRLIHLSGNKFVTVSRLTDRRLLELRLWEAAADGALKCLDTQPGESANEFAVTKCGENRLITIINKGDRLEMRGWEGIANLLRPQSRVENDSGKYSGVTIACDTFGRLITSARDAEGYLKLKSYQLSAEGIVGRIAETSGEKIDAIEPAMISCHDCLFVVSEMPARPKAHRQIKVMTWRSDANGIFVHLETSTISGMLPKIAAGVSLEQSLMVARSGDGVTVTNWSWSGEDKYPHQLFDRL